MSVRNATISVHLAKGVRRTVTCLIMQKVLIIGGGYLGTVIKQHFENGGDTVQIADYPNVDITDISSVETVVASSSPDLFINCAAFTNTNAAEEPANQGTAFALNVQGPANCALACRRHSVPWVHFSTGMMFDGVPAHNAEGWTETDTPQPTGYYTWTKAWADGMLTPFLEEDRILILRIHIPLSNVSHPRNFLNRLLSFDKAVDEPSSITVVEDLLDVLDQLLERKMGGIFNVVNEGTMSSYEITKTLHKYGHGAKDATVLPMSKAELEAAVSAKGGAQQTFPVLSTAKLQALGITMPKAQEAIERTARTFKG